LYSPFYICALRLGSGAVFSLLIINLLSALRYAFADATRVSVSAAQATVSVRIEEKGKTTVGQAADTDTLVASANAYLSALNKLIIKREKTAPDPSLSAQI
jgi:hypothetical protein